MKNPIPKYSIIPFAIILSINTIAYFVTPMITESMHHYDMSCFVDDAIPFLPIFVIPYALAYVQWFVGYLAIANVSKEHCYKIFTGEAIAKTIVCICFLVIPATMPRPEVVGSDIFSQAVRVLYDIDKPINLFPSIHCLESYVCIRGAMNTHYSRTYKVIMAISTALVFMSTVFTKQHVFVDMLGAVIVVEFGLFVARKIYK